MSETVVINAEARKGQGTRDSRQLRNEGRLPAVIYGHGEAVETVSLNLHDVEVALAHGTRLFEVKCGSNNQQCLVKDVQYNHLGSTPIHLDLTRVDLTERVQVTVGIELRGTPQGVGHGGILDQNMVEIEVECMVSNIPDTLHPLVTELEVGQSLLVQDLELPEGVIPLAEGSERICTVNALSTKTEEATVETEEDTAEPERIGRVRAEEEGEAS